MKTKNLTQVCNITTGKLDANAEVENGQYPFFTCAPDPLRIDTFAFDDDVILLAGNNAQGNFHIQRFRGKFNAYQRTYIITAKPGYDIDYIKYSLEISLQHLKKVAQGSQTKFLTMPILDSFQVADIPYDQQRDAIASLREIDRKIEKNKNICTELESMAKTLYDYWFTQFDFPDENGKPYRASGGAMEWNGQLKREIPVGWKTGTLNDLGAITSGGTPSTDNESFYTENGIAWVTPNDLSGNENLMFFSHGDRDITKEGLANSSTLLMPPGTVLFSSRAPIGYIAIAENEVCSNQGFKSIVPNKGYGAYFIYYTLKRNTPAIAQQGVGTTFKEVSRDTMERFQIVLPKQTVAEHFEKVLSAFFEKRRVLEHENDELTKLRDWLLPMLMNGQATVLDEEATARVIEFKNSKPEQYEVRQAARSFGKETKGDTSDLVKEFIKRRNNDT